MLLVRLKSSIGVFQVRGYIIIEGSVPKCDTYQFSDETIFNLSFYNNFSFDQLTVFDNGYSYDYNYDDDYNYEKSTQIMNRIVCKDVHTNNFISFIFKEEAMGEYQKLKRILEDRLAK